MSIVLRIVVLCAVTFGGMSFAHAGAAAAIRLMCDIRLAPFDDYGRPRLARTSRLGDTIGGRYLDGEVGAGRGGESFDVDGHGSRYQESESSSRFEE